MKQSYDQLAISSDLSLIQYWTKKKKKKKKN